MSRHHLRWPELAFILLTSDEQLKEFADRGEDAILKELKDEAEVGSLYEDGLLYYLGKKVPTIQFPLIKALDYEETFEEYYADYKVRTGCCNLHTISS